MQKQYNKNVKYFDYQVGEKVWIKKKVYKPGENRKLSPRKIGPWIVVRKCSNGVNFEIENEKDKKRKIIHHNRLYPFNKSKRIHKVPIERELQSDNDISSSEEETEGDIVPADSEDEAEIVEPRYPTRNRRQPERDGYVSWDVVDSSLTGDS